MAIPRWELASNDFSNGEVISHIAQARGWYVRVDGEVQPVVLWAHVTSTVVPGMQRIVGLVHVGNQMRPADKIENAEGYIELVDPVLGGDRRADNP